MKRIIEEIYDETPKQVAANSLNDLDQTNNNNDETPKRGRGRPKKVNKLGFIWYRKLVKNKILGKAGDWRWHAENPALCWKTSKGDKKMFQIS